jgi:hypothetical protein
MSKKILLIIIIPSVSVLLFWMGFRIWQFHSGRNDIINNIGTISGMELSQQEQSILVNVFADGPREGKYMLDVNVTADGYMKEMLLDVNQEVELKYPKQMFTFKISFDSMSDAYRDKLDSYISVEKKRMVFDEYIDITAGLYPVKYKNFSREEIASMQINVERKKALAQFYFACFKNKCQIIQKDIDDLGPKDQKDQK